MQFKELEKKQLKTWNFKFINVVFSQCLCYNLCQTIMRAGCCDHLATVGTERKGHQKEKSMKKRYFALILTAMLAFAGCGAEKAEHTETTQTEQTQETEKKEEKTE